MRMHLLPNICLNQEFVQLLHSYLNLFYSKTWKFTFKNLLWVFFIFSFEICLLCLWLLCSVSSAPVNNLFILLFNFESSFLSGILKYFFCIILMGCLKLSKRIKIWIIKVSLKCWSLNCRFINLYLGRNFGYLISTWLFPLFSVTGCFSNTSITWLTIFRNLSKIVNFSTGSRSISSFSLFCFYCWIFLANIIEIVNKVSIFSHREKL